MGTKQVHVPLKRGGGSLATGFAPANDVPVDIAPVGLGAAIAAGVVVCIGSRVGGIGAQLFTCGGGDGAHAVAVIGEGHVHLTVQWVDRTPLWPVHWGGTHGIGGQPRVYDDVTLVGKRVIGVTGVQPIASVSQFQPLTRTVCVKPGHVQSALIQVFGPSSQATVGICRIPRVSRHKLVDVLVGRIVAHVKHHRLPGHHGCRPRAFMAETPQCRALGRGGCGLKRVNLHHPAKGLGNVAVVICSRCPGYR